MTKIKYITASFLFLLIISNFGFSQTKNAGQITKTVKRVESYLDKLEAVGFSSTVACRVEWSKANFKRLWFSEYRSKLKNTPDTIFDIGSITKQFTAAAINETGNAGQTQHGR